MPVAWDTLYADRLEKMTTSVIRDILKVAQSPDIIPFAGGGQRRNCSPSSRSA